MHSFHKSFTKSNFEYNNFVDLNDNDLIEILNWRNSDFNRKWMKNTNLISENDHLLYCKKLNDQNIFTHWRLSYNKRYIGVISMNEYYKETNSCEWGFYLSSQSLPEDSITIFHAALILFFEIISFTSLHGSVKIANKSAILLNKYFQFNDVKLKIIDQQTYIILHLNKNEWLLRKNTLDELISEFYNFYKLNKSNYANRK
jgi:UDP-4-amino-4,6-dideoxy-N-acetyl-beta-L-altrosamine N-acetyltransferase